MKAFLLATAATIALCVNAVAADQGQMQSSQPRTEKPMGNTMGMDKPMNRDGQSSELRKWEQQKNAKGIDPSDLNHEQISTIQRELNDQGFNAGSVDGVWGSETRQAIRTFQQQRNLSTAQPLTQETLTALGVDFANASEGTTGSGGASGNTGAGTTGSGNQMDEPAAPSQSNPSR